MSTALRETIDKALSAVASVKYKYKESRKRIIFKMSKFSSKTTFMVDNNVMTLKSAVLITETEHGIPQLVKIKPASMCMILNHIKRLDYLFKRYANWLTHRENPGIKYELRYVAETGVQHIVTVDITNHVISHIVDDTRQPDRQIFFGVISLPA
jgi:hypothetical protein